MNEKQNKRAKEVILSISKLSMDTKNELIKLSNELIDKICIKCPSIAERAFVVETLREGFWSCV